MKERVKLCYESVAVVNLIVSVILNSINFLFLSETLTPAVNHGAAEILTRVCAKFGA